MKKETFNIGELLISKSDLARYAGCHPSGIQYWIATGKIPPPYHKCKSQLYWKAKDVDNLIRAIENRPMKQRGPKPQE